MSVPYRTSFNGRLDRLSSLIDRLRVQVDISLAADGSESDANLRVYESPERGLRLVFCPERDGSAVRAGMEAAPTKRRLSLPGSRYQVSAGSWSVPCRTAFPCRCRKIHISPLS